METEAIHGDDQASAGGVGKGIGVVDDEVRVRAIGRLEARQVETVAQLERGEVVSDGEPIAAGLVGDEVGSRDRGAAEGERAGIAVQGAAAMPDGGAAVSPGDNFRARAACAVRIGVEEAGGDRFARLQGDAERGVAEGEVVRAGGIAAAGAADGEDGEIVRGVHPHEEGRERIAGELRVEGKAVEPQGDGTGSGIGVSGVFLDDHVGFPNVAAGGFPGCAGDAEGTAAEEALRLGARVGVHRENPVSHPRDGGVIDRTAGDRRHHDGRVVRADALEEHGVVQAAGLDHRGRGQAEAVDQGAADERLVGERRGEPGVEERAGTAFRLVAVRAVAVEVGADVFLV